METLVDRFALKIDRKSAPTPTSTPAPSVTVELQLDGVSERLPTPTPDVPAFFSVASYGGNVTTISVCRLPATSSGPATSRAATESASLSASAIRFGESVVPTEPVYA